MGKWKTVRITDLSFLSIAVLFCFCFDEFFLFTFVVLLQSEGKGTEIQADGERYSGAWKNNVKEGVGELRWPTGKWREGLWSRGRRVKWLGSEHVGGKRK